MLAIWNQRLEMLSYRNLRNCKVTKEEEWTAIEMSIGGMETKIEIVDGGTELDKVW
jgi:hypothetical protein